MRNEQFKFNNRVDIRNIIEAFKPEKTFQLKTVDIGTDLIVNLPNELSKRKDNGLIQESKLGSLGKYHDYDFRQYKGEQPMNKIARNLVDYEAGKTIFETMLFNLLLDISKYRVSHNTMI